VQRAGRAVQLAALRAQERERRREQLQHEVEQLRIQQAGVLAATGCPTVAEAEARLQRYRDLVRERQQASDYLTRRREGSDDETIAERWKTVRRDIFGLEERLRAPEVAAKRMTPLQVQGLERQVREMEQLLAQAQRREMKLTVDLERLAADAEQLAAKEEQLAEAEDALAAARRHHEICREALAGLTEARRQAEIPLRQVVETRAGEYLAVATGGRYTRLVVEQETLKLSVWSTEAADWVEAAEPHLSRGTVDLVYLAVRLALVTVLTGGKHPPLLFDDPFITFDDRRRAGALALLRELSREHQVFLFTCSRTYDDAADRVIELPDRTTGKGEPARVPLVTARSAPADTPVPQDAPAAEPAVGPLWEQR
jgi:DNA repair exonuclease SbcCD ATPase subunit